MKFSTLVGFACAAAIAVPAVAGAAEPPAAFTPCKTCHKTEAGGKSIGPSLFGVIGRKAGTLDGFTYSDAMKAAGWTWDADHLTKYIADPKAVVPGTKMVYAGLQDGAKVKEIVDFLATLK